MIAARTQVHLFFSWVHWNLVHTTLRQLQVWTEFLLSLARRVYGFKEKSWQSAVENDKVFATFALILALGMPY